MSTAELSFGSDRWFVRTRSGRAILAGVIAVLLCALPSRVAPTIYNNYVLFADALLHHHLWISNWPGPRIDAVLFHGHRYIVNDPVPGLLLLPYVALLGLQANQTLLAVMLGGVAAGATWRTAENLGLPLWRTFVLCAFIFGGTDLWWASTLGDVWFLAQTAAFAFTMLCLMQLSGPRARGSLVALAYGLAVGSRFTMVMALPVIAYLVYRGNLGAPEPAPGGLRRLASFALVTALFAALWMWYNELRWGVPWDSGHTIFYHEDVDVGSPAGSPFGLSNLPMQLQSFFLAPPLLGTEFPFVTPLIKGTALTYTSPTLVFAFFAREPRASVRALWVAIVLVAAPSFLYYVNGYAQYGMRHALDFEPFLFILLVFAARNVMPRWVSWTTLYSILASGVGIWYWLAIVRAATTVGAS